MSSVYWRKRRNKWQAHRPPHTPTPIPEPKHTDMSLLAAQSPPDAAAAPAFGLTGAFEADTVALKRYCDFLRQTESIRAQLMESAAQLDAYIQQQIDLARGK
jgi:hypothetical protein